MSGLKKREKCFIAVALLLCVAIVWVVVMLFFQLKKTSDLQETPTQGTDLKPETMLAATPTMTPIPTDVIVVPGTEAPVFFGVSSTISVDCIESLYVKQQIIDRLFYLGYVEGTDYNVTETATCTTIQMRLEIEKEAFEGLYTQMLNLIYDCNVSQHLENGISVDKKGIQSDDQYSYLTMYLYFE